MNLSAAFLSFFGMFLGTLTCSLLAGPALAMDRIPFPDPRLPVFGLGWFAEDQPRLSRFPVRLKETVNYSSGGMDSAVQRMISRSGIRG